MIFFFFQLGNLLHGMIMVPYYPWKISHHHHHKNTGNIDKDEIFYPVRQTEGEQVHINAIEDLKFSVKL